VALCFCLEQRAAAQIFPSQSTQWSQGPPSAALLAYPTRVSLDTKGIVYIADTDNNRVRKVAGGKITTIAGTGSQGFSGDGRAAISAQLDSPSGVAIHAARFGADED